MDYNKLNRDIIIEFQATIYANYFYAKRLLSLGGFSTKKLEDLDLETDLYELGGSFSKLYKDFVDKDTFNKLKEGDDYLAKILQRGVLVNRGLVKVIASRYARYAPSLDLGDLIGYGYIGLIRALYGYDPERSIPFCNYADLWIKQAIGFAIKTKGKLVKIPVNKEISYRHLKIDAKKSDIELENINQEEIERLCKCFGYDPSWVSEQITQLNTRTVSLDRPAGLNSVFMDFLASDYDLEKEFLRQETSRILQRFIAVLPEKKRKIIEERYYKDKTLEEIGITFGYTRERIRQLEREALKKIRFYFRTRSLTLEEI
ncbi:MAG TPA: sigma-70 family RNA polymerase sigma factor [Candidatus Nanoarchaeia archaeon]|nr:sigma-70 family RNA polymerase sigma factor [Candidatus Nanoarchaeia archaeon]